MVSFLLNGQTIQTDVEKNLLDFLRNDIGIKSVKDGCSEGACGTCSVLVDGASKRACTQKVQKLEGKNIVTIEGLSDYEQQVYSYCFAKAGAVQCGFCIPGMVISAKALLDKNNNPTEAEIAKALVGNICRCTGYKKIIEAIKNAAEYIKEQKQVKLNKSSSKIMEKVFRPDAYEKTLGTGKYTDDLVFEDMIYASAVRSEYPRAIVEDIDLAEALKHPDVITIITAEDIPGNKKAGHIVKDWDTLIAKGDTTRYIGDAIVLVVSKRYESLDEIKELVKVEYTELKPVNNPQEALMPSAPMLHESGNVLRHDRVVRGEDIDEVLKKSKHVVSHVYNTPFTEHAYMEPECAICKYGEDELTLYTSDQNIFDDQKEIAHILGMDKEKVHVISMLVGGGFGGKEDMSVQHHAALAAYITKKTVKVKLSRQESLHVSTKRHAMTIETSTGCDENGKLTGVKVRILSDTGAYASLGGPVVQRACTHAGGPYQYDSVDIEGKAVYTNNTPGGAFRGFGVTQSCFAIESNLNLLAEKVGISPWEIRYKNAVVPNSILPNGQIADESTALKECLEAVKDICQSNPNAGIAAALKNTGLGVGVPDTGRCIASVQDGKIHIRTGAARIGQGLDTVLLQMACETLDMQAETFVIEMPNTKRTPNSGTTTASRQTMFTGHATVEALTKIKLELEHGRILSDLEGQEFYGEYTCITDPITTDKEHPYSHAGYSYGVQVVELDDVGKVKEVHAVYDVGQLINRNNAEGQVEGGIVMGLGYALTEDFPLEDAVPNVKYGTLGLFRATQIPQMSVEFIDKEFKLDMAYGAKGLGEIATIPTAPAVAGAYYFRDRKHRTKLPLDNTAYRK